MAEYIELESVIESIIGEPTESHYPSWYADKIKEIPTADVSPVVHGRWEHMHDFVFLCTNCGNISEVETCIGKPKWSYCPHCGARMDLKEG